MGVSVTKFPPTQYVIENPHLFHVSLNIFIYNKHNILVWKHKKTWNPNPPSPQALKKLIYNVTQANIPFWYHFMVGAEWVVLSGLGLMVKGSNRELSSIVDLMLGVILVGQVHYHDVQSFMNLSSCGCEASRVYEPTRTHAKRTWWLLGACYSLDAPSAIRIIGLSLHPSWLVSDNGPPIYGLKASTNGQQ